ncbi:hypothetical protein QBC47DRAFT_364035 [Echria macrotheca]|uniref:Uncharacterized protein n=1 Tax=Echria macrotheca TaxID=438768 RepID=A0AAJ0B7M6_9PEZI|nr:hypothetical protein QBC47DRAFT_364035 [Echria macrotheca]
MDAQNAVEPASTKPAASPKRPGSDADQSRAPKLSAGTKPDLSSKDGRPTASAASANEDDGAGDGNSDAETIVLPGKDGHSPSKVRKIIKREDKSDAEDGPSTVPRARKSEPNGKRERERDGEKGDRADRKDKSVSVAENTLSDRAGSLGVKKKKLTDKPKAKDGSSGLSSAPASPPQRRRRASNAHSKSDSETAQVESPKASTKEKPKSSDKVVPHKRKAPRPDSDDEAENRKVRRQRTSGSGLDASRKSHVPQKSHHEPQTAARTRSVSPQPRAHRRSVSTQLPGPASNGLSHKKKRIPAPLQSTDYHSDESSASGSPHPRSSKIRSLTTPATTESTISPAKMAPHKKHLDAHGQTFLARACAKGEYEIAKQRLQDRPEDINVADYAGNTPLQIAALNGYEDIVKLLVDAGCNLDCVNNDKDTPLLDAVENGHIGVVRILLNAGVNPRKANAYGQEPIDLLTDQIDNADEIKRALQDAKQRMGERRRTSEDHHLDHTDARSSHGPESPRRSPGAAGSIHAASGRRAGTVRSTKTSNHLLYMPMDDKTLRAAAARGDEETVTRILQVRDTFDDPDSMVAAARGGHDIVMQLLLALGKANPDPNPVGSSDYSTPMLAAIGQENIKVIQLLLDQNDFNPTRRIRGETYYEIARRRRGPNWADEEHLLKQAYDSYEKSHKNDPKRSPNKKEQDRESRRSRPEPKEEPSRSHKRKASSPAREPKKTAPPKVSTSPKEKRRSNSFTTHTDDHISPKRGPGRPKKEDRIPTIAISDREASPAGKQPTTKAKRTQPDLAASSEGEAVKPRRKLISARELKGERAQQNRRASLTSNASSLKEPSSPREEPEKAQKTEKYHDRTKALKRDESRDRLSVSGEGSGKRHRSSATPPHPGSTDKDTGEGPVKRRRLDVDGKERRLKPSTSDDRHLKAPSSRDSASNAAGGPRIRSKSRDDDERRPAPKTKKVDAAADSGRRESGKSISSESSIHVKSEDPDVDMPDAHPVNDSSSSKSALLKEKEAEEKKKLAEAEAQEAKRKEEEKRQAEEKERERLRLEEEARQRAEAEARRREEEERKQKEEEERRKKEEEERKQRELEERKRQEEEEAKRQQEEAERKRKEEEERKRKEELERVRKLEEEKKRREEEERKRQEEEEERKRREEEERLRREQLEREAAEELRRKREEEERKEQERKQEMERRRQAKEAERAAREAEARRVRQEQERARLAKLPALLRWLDSSVNPKVAEVAEQFRILQGVRFDCIRPEATGTPEGKEQWLLNTQVALLLGEKDLGLSRYTAWNHIPASQVAKRVIWRLEADRYALTSPSLYDLGRQLPGYYPGNEPEGMGFRALTELRAEAEKKFLAMDMFFVKASDFMYIVPRIEHLRNVKLTMEYRELPENEADLNTWRSLQKWKNDPGSYRNRGFAPGKKHYINGEFVSEDGASLSAVSPSPFPEKRVPRRGLIAVSPDDPAFATLCKEQGLDDLVDRGSPLLPNGIQASSMGHMVNGLGSPASPVTGVVNQHGNHPISPSSEAGPAQARPLVNGTNGMVNGNSTI